MLLPSVAAADGIDPFDADGDIPQTPASSMLGGGACAFGAPGQPLSLTEAVERALCGHPKTMAAWAGIKEQAAAVGVAKGAYLPTFSGSVQEMRDGSKTKVVGHPELETSVVSTAYSAGISLSWVLYDFGGREAALDNATELLAAAQASHQAALQLVFATVAKDYYAAQARQSLLTAALETERMAKHGFDIATRLVHTGVSPVSDALQAETVLVQAQVDRARAEGDARSAVGLLAADMMLRPDTPVTLPDADTGLKPDAAFENAVSALIDDAVRRHPSVRAAEAQLRAAEAGIRRTEAEGLPTVSLVGRSSRDNQPVSEGLGLRSYAATKTDKYVGLQVTVPLFEGFQREYKVRQAKAQTEAQQASLDDTRRQVGLDVWTAYQAVQTATQNLVRSAKLLDIAQQSCTVSQRQYTIGTGSMIELLNTQSALAAAKRQKVQSLADWRTSRLDLASKLGRLAMDGIEGE
ncbi:TolC family protein [Telmatospirillum siberiense]|uniref:Protein CyaE n=2 Tax=Telmatospirillum siberiense TaxID=382514 RepID=A0A2N3PLU8_9PROT|nr:TolC family protein [Telmatospirillum siberiense]